MRTTAEARAALRAVTADVPRRPDLYTNKLVDETGRKRDISARLPYRDPVNLRWLQEAVAKLREGGWEAHGTIDTGRTFRDTMHIHVVAYVGA